MDSRTFVSCCPLSWRLYWHTLGGAWKAFGLGREWFLSAFRRPAFTGVMRLSMLFDHLICPGFRRTVVKQPVFLIGHPRSGTTFVHRLLTQTREFSVFEFWEILVPSLFMRSLVRRLVQRKIARERGVFFPKETGHLGSLDEVEEEELLFLHTGNTQFTSCLTPLAFSDWDFAELVRADEQHPAERRRSMRFLNACLKRQQYATGKERSVTKMNYSAMRIRSLLNEFPDARIIYILRSPLETVPSHLTLHRNMFDHMWGLSRIPETLLRRYYERRYRHNVDFYRYLKDVIEQGAIPRDQLLIVPYEDLVRDLAGTMDRIIEFTHLPVSSHLRDLIVEQAQRQEGYQRPHRNLALGEFGLTEDCIRQDFDFILSKESPHDARTQRST